MDAGWAQWLLGAALGVTQLIVGWIGHRLYEFFKEVYRLKERVSLLEAKQHVDPVEHAKTMVKLANAIEKLTDQLIANDRHRTEQIERLAETQERMFEVIEKLRADFEEKE